MVIPAPSVNNGLNPLPADRLPPGGRRRRRSATRCSDRVRVACSATDNNPTRASTPRAGLHRPSTVPRAANWCGPDGVEVLRRELDAKQETTDGRTCWRQPAEPTTDVDASSSGQARPETKSGVPEESDATDGQTSIDTTDKAAEVKAEDSAASEAATEQVKSDAKTQVASAAKAESEQTGTEVKAEDSAEAEEAAESEAVEPAVARGRSRLTRGWLVGITAALVLAAGGIGFGGYLALRSEQDSKAIERNGAAARRGREDLCRRRRRRPTPRDGRQRTEDHRLRHRSFPLPGPPVQQLLVAGLSGRQRYTFRCRI